MRDSHAPIMSAILRDTPRPLGEVAAHLSSGITPIIERCLEKRPEARYASAGELREALRDLHPAGPAARGSARRTFAGAALLLGEPPKKAMSNLVASVLPAPDSPEMTMDWSLREPLCRSESTLRPIAYRWGCDTASSFFIKRLVISKLYSPCNGR